MRPIDADRFKAELNNIYKKAAELKDLELKKLVSVCVGLLDRAPTLDTNAINTQYDSLSIEQRLAIDELIRVMINESEKR